MYNGSKSRGSIVFRVEDSVIDQLIKNSSDKAAILISSGMMDQRFKCIDVVGHGLNNNLGMYLLDMVGNGLSFSICSLDWLGPESIVL